MSLQDSVSWQMYLNLPPNSGGSYWEVMSYDIVQYLYNHVRCCQLRALHDFFRHVSTFLCQFVVWLQMPLIVLEFLPLLLVLHIQHVVLASGSCRFKRSLLTFSQNCLLSHML